MKTLKQSLKLLDETIKFYTLDKNPRSFVEHNEMRSCRYYYKGLTCAVGRCLVNPKDKDRILASKYNSCGSGSASDLYNTFSQVVFKKQYRGFKVEVWDKLQSLHDYESNWDGFELTTTGSISYDIAKKAIINLYTEN